MTVKKRKQNQDPEGGGTCRMLKVAVVSTLIDADQLSVNIGGAHRARYSKCCWHWEWDNY